MKIKEITNAQDQLDLLRVIIDNTWSAIRQQAQVQANQKAKQTSKPKAPKPPKKAPYAATPKPLPKPNPIQQKTKPQLPPNQANLGAPKQGVNKSEPVRSPEEMRMFMNYLKGEKAKTHQVNQNQGFIPNQ